MKENRGITLIALVITIIILLILAGVSLNLIAGSEGILKKTENATNEHQKAQIKEELDIILIGIKADLIVEKGKFTLEDLADELRKYTEIEIKEVDTENERIKIDYKNYEFYVYGDLKSELIGEGETGNINKEIKINLEKNPITEEDVKQNNYEFATINATIEPIDKITKVTINEKEIEFDSTTGAISEQVTENGIYKIVAYGENGEYNFAKVRVEGLTENLEIWSEEELVQFRDSVNKGRTYVNKKITLKKDLNLQNICGETIGSWEPIANFGTDTTHIFKGTFDGEKHTIENMYINNTSNYQGLFGFNQGNIENLTISGRIVNTGSYTGGIVGYSTGNLQNCINNAYIQGYADVGGIAGHCSGDGTIKQCCNLNEIYATGGQAGGIVGCTEEATIKECYNTGYIHGVTVSMGGINGYMKTGTIYNCYNTGKIEGPQFIGGIAGAAGLKGYPTAYIYNCYNVGTILGAYSDSIIGAPNANKGSSAYFNCYSTEATVELLNAGEYSDNVWITHGEYPILSWQLLK